MANALNKYELKFEFPVKSELESVRVCRGCLSTDGRMFDIRERRLEQSFSELTGLTVAEGLLCSVCLQLLRKFSKFRSRCVDACHILQQLNPLNGNTLSKVDRRHLKLGLMKTKVWSFSCNPKNVVSKKMRVKCESLSKSGVITIDIAAGVSWFSAVKETCSTYLNKATKLQSVKCGTHTTAGNPFTVKIEACNSQKENDMDFLDDEFDRDESIDQNFNEDIEYSKRNIDKTRVASKVPDSAVVRVKKKDASTIKKPKQSSSKKQLISGKHKVRYRTKPGRCPQCGAAFPTEQLMKRHRYHAHMKLSHKRKQAQKKKPKKPVLVPPSYRDDKHMCDVCGKQYISAAALGYHQRIHTGEKPHKCDHCGKAFRMVHLLNSHRLTHTGERRYKCEVCQKAFRDSSHLNRHILSHSTEKRFACALCPKRYTYRCSLREHVRTAHEGLPPFPRKVHRNTEL